MLPWHRLTHSSTSLCICMHFLLLLLQLMLFSIHFSVYLSMLHCFVHFDSQLVLVRYFWSKVENFVSHFGFWWWVSHFGYTAVENGPLILSSTVKMHWEMTLLFKVLLWTGTGKWPSYSKFYCEDALKNDPLIPSSIMKMRWKMTLLSLILSSVVKMRWKMTLLSLILSSTVKMHYSKAALYLVLFVVAVHFMSSQRHQLYQLLDHGFILMHHSNMQRTGKTQGHRLPDTLVIQLFKVAGYRTLSSSSCLRSQVTGHSRHPAVSALCRLQLHPRSARLPTQRRGKRSEQWQGLGYS